MREAQPRNRTAPQCGAVVVPSVITGMLRGLPGEGGLGLPYHCTAASDLTGSPEFLLPVPAQSAALVGSDS